MIKIKQSSSYLVFQIFNYIFMSTVALACIVPIVHVFAISLSAEQVATAGGVGLWPVDFTLVAYDFVLKTPEFWRSMWVSIQRLVLGGVSSIFITILVGYPLSKDSNAFPARRYYVWFFFFTMLFSGGLIPTYLMIKYTGLIDRIWALVIPGAVSVWNIILILNFFRQLPKELEEAAFLDGANHWTILWKIFFPLSLPSTATISLFVLVTHWNAWFDGMIYMNRPEHYPLQTYLQTILISDDTRALDMSKWQEMQAVSIKTLKAAQVFIGALPILCVYPFLQKYFTQGLTLGSVKG